MSEEDPVTLKQCKFPTCGYETKSANALKVHQQKHSTDPTVQRPYPCNYCPYRAIVKNVLESHVKRLHCDKYPFSCSVPKCNYKAKIISDLRLHQRDRHSSATLACTSEACDFKTKFKSALKSHILHCHTPTRQKSHDCTFCAQRFFRADTLRGHLMTHTKEKPWRCSMCSYESKSKAHVRRHAETHHQHPEGTAGNNSKEKGSYRCSSCDFSTMFKERLETHVDTHSKEKPHACKYPGCNFTAKRKLHLQVHETVNHAPQRHPCPQPGCKYVAKHKQHISFHNTRVHRKQFSCEFPQCNRQFKTEAILINHQRLHDPTRSFQCETCGLRLKTALLLGKHIRLRHQEKHLECPRCDFRTNQRGNLRGHLKKIHQAEDIVCSEPGCDFKSCSPQDMTFHSRRHNAESHPFKCAYCPYRYTLRNALKGHVKREHSDARKQVPRNGGPSRSSRDVIYEYASKALAPVPTNKEACLSGHEVPIVLLTKVLVDFL